MLNPARRTRKQAQPVDVAPFRPQIEEAMRAFRADVSYAVEMARAAVTITRKREVWKTRQQTAG